MRRCDCLATVRSRSYSGDVDGLGERRAPRGVLKPPDERERAVEIVSVEDRLVDVLDAECRASLG